MKTLRFEPLEVMEIEGNYLIVYKWDDLSEHTSPKVWENVELLNPNGERIWTVNGMENYPHWNKKNDTFVGMKNKNSSVQLISYTGNSYGLDLKNGKVEFSEFLK